MSGMKRLHVDDMLLSLIFCQPLKTDFSRTVSSKGRPLRSNVAYLAVRIAGNRP